MDQESSWREEETVVLEMTSDMQGMMWGEPELSGLLAWDDAVVLQPVAKLANGYNLFYLGY